VIRVYWPTLRDNMVESHVPQERTLDDVRRNASLLGRLKAPWPDIAGGETTGIQIQSKTRDRVGIVPCRHQPEDGRWRLHVGLAMSKKKP